MSRKPIDTHVTRISDSSHYDEICVLCGKTDSGPLYKEPCRLGSDIDPSHKMRVLWNPPANLGRNTISCDGCGEVWAGVDQRSDIIPERLRLKCKNDARGPTTEEITPSTSPAEPIIGEKAAELRIETEKFDLLYTFKPSDDNPEEKAKEVVESILSFLTKESAPQFTIPASEDLRYYTETPHGTVRGPTEAISYVCDLVARDTTNQKVGPHLSISGKGFRADLEALINAYGVDNSYSIPDYALADYLQTCIEACGLVTKRIAVHAAAAKETLNG